MANSRQVLETQTAQLETTKEQTQRLGSTKSKHIQITQVFELHILKEDKDHDRTQIHKEISP